MKVVSNLFSFTHPESLEVDRIVLTYNPPKAVREKIREAIMQIGWLQAWAEKKLNSHPIDSYKAYVTPTWHYKSVVDLSFPDEVFSKDNHVRLELDSRVKKTAFMRIEYNPSMVSFEMLASCLNSVMPEGVEPILEDGKVTRIDIAMDIKDVQPYQIILDYVKSRFRICYLESGKPDSIYLGKDTGENQIYMYDKAKEQKGNKVKPFSGSTPPGGDLTRIELRHRPKKKLTVSDLLALDNLLFDRLFIIGTPPKVKGDADFDIKRDLCVLNGLRKVAKQLKASGDFDGFVDQLEKYAVKDFLDLHKLWGTLPEAIKKVYPGMGTFMTSVSNP